MLTETDQDGFGEPQLCVGCMSPEYGYLYIIQQSGKKCFLYSKTGKAGKGFKFCVRRSGGLPDIENSERCGAPYSSWRFHFKVSHSTAAQS